MQASLVQEGLLVLTRQGSCRVKVASALGRLARVSEHG